MRSCDHTQCNVSICSAFAAELFYAIGFSSLQTEAEGRWSPLLTNFDCMLRLALLVAALAVGPLGNLRHDSALMGAITKTKGKQALPERVPVRRHCFASLGLILQT